jgi:uncharacterized protein YjbI with pentapeptide repeats
MNVVSRVSITKIAHSRLILGMVTAIAALCSTLQPAQAFNREHVKQLLNTNKCPGCDLSYADLSGKNLKEADLTGANLNAANLQDAKLQGANLTGANLNLVDFSKAKLNGANLTGASLVLARFNKARLDGANLTKAILDGQDKLSRAKSFEGAILPNGSTGSSPKKKA